MDIGEQGFIKLGAQGSLLPQEEMLEVKKDKRMLIIGVPRETSFQENRISLVPAAAELLVQNGHRVIVESHAGRLAHFPDNEFAEAGAEIVSSAEEVYQSDIILKVAPPSLRELDMMKARQVIFSALHLTAQTAEYFRKLMAKKATAISFEHIKDKSGSYPVIRSLSEITGNAAIMIAADYLSDPEYGKGSMLGGFSGITPTEVIVLGAGTVAENAIRAAMGMGAVVKVFDNSIYKLRALQLSLGERLFTSILEPRVLKKALRTADVVIGALHETNGRTPCVVTEEMVKGMKQGSVVVDISIVQGGCFETSYVTNHNSPVFSKYGVTHYCVPNIPSRVPHTASYALSNFFSPLMLKAGDAGGIEGLLKSEYGLRQGIYMYNGTLTNQYVSEIFNLPFKAIELLFSAYR